VEVPFMGNADLTRTDSGKVELNLVTGIGLSLDSWDAEPFTVWLDGLSVD
jgi:hypothetical protein